MKLEVKNIKKKFGEVEVLHGVSFHVEKGKALGLLGRNGAGKTTTIRILMRLFEANEGEILLDGKPFDPKSLQIGYLPEERGLYPKKKILEQLVYLAELRGLSRKQAKTNAEKWLTRLEVISHKDKKLETLSKGNQQKVQLASTFMCEPDVVILDEPFSGLDPVNSQLLKEIIREQIETNKLVIFSSHQMGYVEEFCEEIALIDKGNIVLTGNLKAIKNEYGQGRFILVGENLSSNDTANHVREAYKDFVKTTEVKRHGVVIELKETVEKYDFISALGRDRFDLEMFSKYHPSLEDIFIEKVGDK